MDVRLTFRRAHCSLFKEKDRLLFLETNINKPKHKKTNKLLNMTAVTFFTLGLPSFLPCSWSHLQAQTLSLLSMGYEQTSITNSTGEMGAAKV